VNADSFIRGEAAAIREIVKEGFMRPREQLEGEKLPGGWIVGKMITKKGGTGSNFSVGYIVTNESGREYYLKAMDYHDAMLHPDTPRAMKWFTDMYLFEKTICDACRDAHLDRVVHAIESGSITPPAAAPYGKVEYMIMELADGDVRGLLDRSPTFDTTFMLRVLHNVGVGLKQMHHEKMAHQDMKPSNTLILKDRTGAKIGDLGRAWSETFPAPHDTLGIPGDRTYAPPELSYGQVSSDHRCRRFASDLYHFGNLIAFVFARVHINSLLLSHLASEHKPLRWAGTFTEVLPYVKTAFGAALTQIAPVLPAWPRDELLPMIKELCEPDPEMRGHPLNRVGHQNKYALDRYISKLDLLSRRSEIGLVGAK
jgi:serine/threonine protein kinase